MAKAAERAAKATERTARTMAKAAKRTGEPRAKRLPTAGDLLRETAEQLGVAVGMNERQTRELHTELIEVWTRHYSRLR